MQLKLALQGKLSDVMEKHYSEGAKAVTLGITAATNGLKTSLREQVRSAGMSSRMANTWRGVVYPKGKPSISAAGQVYSNAEKIMQGFEYASIIRGKNGLWLAIPTDAIPKKARGKRMTPGLYEQMKGVRLQFVYRRNACSLLVHTKKKKTVIAFICHIIEALKFFVKLFYAPLNVLVFFFADPHLFVTRFFVHFFEFFKKSIKLRLIHIKSF